MTTTGVNDRLRLTHRRSQRGHSPPPPREWEKLHNRFSCATGTNTDVKVLWLVIVNGNVTKYMTQKCQT